LGKVLAEEGKQFSPRKCRRVTAIKVKEKGRPRAADQFEWLGAQSATNQGVQVAGLTPGTKHEKRVKKGAFGVISGGDVREVEFRLLFRNKRCAQQPQKKRKKKALHIGSSEVGGGGGQQRWTPERVEVGIKLGIGLKKGAQQKTIEKRAYPDGKFSQTGPDIGSKGRDQRGCSKKKKLPARIKGNGAFGERRAVKVLQRGRYECVWGSRRGKQTRNTRRANVAGRHAKFQEKKGAATEGKLTPTGAPHSARKGRASQGSKGGNGRNERRVKKVRKPILIQGDADGSVSAGSRERGSHGKQPNVETWEHCVM